MLGRLAVATLLASISSSIAWSGVFVNLGELPLEIPDGFEIHGARDDANYSYLGAINASDLESPLRGINVYHALKTDPLTVGLPTNFRFDFCMVSAEGYLLRQYRSPPRMAKELVLISTHDMVVNYLGERASILVRAMRTIPDSDWATDPWRSDSLDLCLSRVAARVSGE